MGQDEVSRLSDDIKELTAAVHEFKEDFAASEALQKDQIARLQRSDDKQWDIIRETQ